MRKKWINLLAALLTGTALLLPGHAAQAAEPVVQVELDGKLLSLTQDPVVWQDRTYVPFRDIFETLGATVEWNTEQQSVTAKKDDVTVMLYLRSNLMIRNGVPIDMGTFPMIYEDRFMVPVRFIAEAMNNPVMWDEANKTVRIAKSNRSKIDDLLAGDRLEPMQSYHFTSTYESVVSTKADRADGLETIEGDAVVLANGQIEAHTKHNVQGTMFADMSSYESYLKSNRVYVAVDGTNKWLKSATGTGALTFAYPFVLDQNFMEFAKYSTLGESEGGDDEVTVHILTNQFNPESKDMPQNLPMTVQYVFDKSTHHLKQIHVLIDYQQEENKFYVRFDVKASNFNSVPSIVLPSAVENSAIDADLSHFQ